MKLYLILLVALLAGGRPAVAQAPIAPAEWAPRRWTVGVQAAFYPRIAYEPATDGSGAVFVRPWPLMPTIAYRIKQKTSLELGLLLRTMPQRTSAFSDGYGTSVTQANATSWAVPIITRAHLLLPNPGRWQADFEIGFMPLSASYRQEQFYTNAQTGQQSKSGEVSYSYNDFLFVGGVGGAYVLTPNLRLTADARVTYSVLLAVVGVALSKYGIQNSISAFAPALSGGMSYQFGKTL
ncbi:hypothetical protein Q5H92_21630 [Hymenobacter sp. M29]|uniref:Outer membrane protein beta-barrel domain-containing protein n=1 Tax=Hymenobacter mellowenesis TaxID=3063995 RepID=A0ABT9AGI4_9BACT|nr:hypothetical protein [Hymenobacter sp. M29]MDO7848980.1 hypothetical protein [Hymenobacter sp. M29]